MTAPSDDRPSLDLKPREIFLGVSAALITAVASSALGVAGTIGGAAVGSVLTPVSVSLLRHSAERTNRRLRRRITGGVAEPAWAARRSPLDTTPGGVGWPDAGPNEPVGLAPDGLGSEGFGPAARGPSGPAGGGGIPDPLSGYDGPGGRAAASGGLAYDGPGPGGGSGAEHASHWADDFDPHARTNRSRVRRRWIAVGVGAALMFLVALTAITGAEALIGKPLSSLFGRDSGSGSSIGTVIGGGSKSTTPEPTGKPETGQSETGQQTSPGAPTSAGSSEAPTSSAPATNQPAPPPTSPADPPAAPGGDTDAGADTGAPAP